MELDRSVCERASRSRDPRFDGRFFVGVRTTGVYCRPICPAPPARSQNVRYFPSAAAAAAAGFRPCLRCRPEASPGTPAWLGTSALVSRGLRLVDEGALDDGRGVEALAERLGVTARHLRRLFQRHLGATPLQVALTRRLHFAKKLIDETVLPFTEVALASGFGSIRRFNGEIRRTYDRTPTELRRQRAAPRSSGSDGYRFRLAYRPPYDWDEVLAFLRARAIPGVEHVDDRVYRRTIAVDGQTGTIEVSHAASGPALELLIRFPNPRALLGIVTRVRRLFDLDADPDAIAAHLGADPVLAGLLAKRPGIRTPGAWDPFELAVRAILGQQISVRAASTIAGRVVDLFGAAIPGPAGTERLFPPAARLVRAEIERAGVVRVRAEAIRRLARRAAAGDLVLSSLTSIPGVGPWTAQYVAMRAFGEPDAFPSGDLVLRQVTGSRTAGELERRSGPWRPWRAYAVMLLWQGAKDDAKTLVHRDRKPGRAAPSGSGRRRSAANRLPDGLRREPAAV
jgi:AraC family transcriptional regulator of adaptative response / DNA-3-methyladenine glycosylase II